MMGARPDANEELGRMTDWGTFSLSWWTGCLLWTGRVSVVEENLKTDGT